MDLRRWSALGRSCLSLCGVPSLLLGVGLALVLLLGACGVGSADGDAPEDQAAGFPPLLNYDTNRYGDLVPGEAAPAFVGTQEWFNSEPLTLEGLVDSGQVVLVDFWTFGCFNCRNTQPYLLEWHERYGEQGLTIVGVHTPEFTYERDAENVREAILEAGIRYPVVQDNDRRTWRAFDNHVWPAFFLVGSDGTVVYRHFGEGRYEETEQAIRAALIEAGHDLTGTTGPT